MFDYNKNRLVSVAFSALTDLQRTCADKIPGLGGRTAHVLKMREGRPRHVLNLRAFFFFF